MSRRKMWMVLCVFMVSFIFHLIGINGAGRTWDEQFKVDWGYFAWDRMIAGDFSVDSWNVGTEHPMVAKYIYGAFLPLNSIRLNRADDPSKIRNDFSMDEKIKLTPRQYMQTRIGNAFLAVDYDWTWIRVVSAFFNSLALAGVFLICSWFIEDNWALLAPMVLLFMPRFIAMGKQITFESITVGLIVWTVIIFEWLMKKQGNAGRYLLVGLFCGLLVFTRYNNVYVFVLLGGWWIIRQLSSGRKKLFYRLFNWRLILIPITGLVYGIVTWPLLWHQFPKYLVASVMENQTRPIGPNLYYLESLLVTTPVLWLLGLVLGVWVLIKKGERKSWQILWWLGSVFLVFSLLGIKMGGTRYIFFVYPAMGVVAAVGLEFWLKKIKWGRYLLIPIVLYGLWVTITIHPYYLDYYNEAVGGVGGAVRQKLDVSYWGEGQREVGLYLNEIGRAGASVSRLVTPLYVMPPLRKDFVVAEFGAFKGEDYVVVSRADEVKFRGLSEGKYKSIYEAKAGGVVLVSLWQRI